MSRKSFMRVESKDKWVLFICRKFLGDFFGFSFIGVILFVLFFSGGDCDMVKYVKVFLDWKVDFI